MPKPVTLFTCRLSGLRDGRAIFRLDCVANAEPKRLLVWSGVIFSAVSSTEADYRLQILAHVSAGEALFQMSIQRKLIFMTEYAVN